MAKVGTELSSPFKIGRGTLEGDICSPINFNVGLESIFREADEVNNLHTKDGVTIKGNNIDKFGFADDVTMISSEGPDRLSTSVQNVQYFSSRAGLSVSATKTYSQHIGRGAEAPAVTSADIEALKMPVCCPVSWCTRRFSNKTELRGHQLWHTKRSRCCADQERLAQGSILCARGPPDNRYYRVFWRDASPQWLRHTQFTVETLPIVELFFQMNSHLNRNTGIEVT